MVVQGQTVAGQRGQISVGSISTRMSLQSSLVEASPANQGGNASDSSRNGFRSIFEQFFGGRQGATTPQAERGADLEYGLQVDFWQAIRGTQVKLNISRQEVCETCHGSGSSGNQVAVCPECDGTGTVTQMTGAMKFNLQCQRCGGTGRLKNACPTCRGEGRIARPDTVEVRIPPGCRVRDAAACGGKRKCGVRGWAWPAISTLRFEWKIMHSFSGVAIISRSKFL